MPGLSSSYQVSPHYGGDSGMSGPHTPAHVSPHFPRHPKDSTGRIPLSHNFRASTFWLCKITAPPPRPPVQFLYFPVSSPPTSAQVLICIFISMQSQPLAERLNGSSFDFTAWLAPQEEEGSGNGGLQAECGQTKDPFQIRESEGEG